MSETKKKLLDINELPEATDNDNLVTGRGNSFRRFSFINFKNYILGQVSSTIESIQGAITNINNNIISLENYITEIFNFLNTVSLINICRQITYNNIGEISASTIILDITRKWNIIELTGTNTTLTIEDISPTVNLLEPSNYTIINKSGITKTIILNPLIFDNPNSTINIIILPTGYKVLLNIRKNPINESETYEVTVGIISYNQTGSLNNTTWNENNKHPQITLSNSFKTVSFANGTTYRSVFAFGAKNTGKHRLSIRLDSSPFGNSSNSSAFSFGIATLAMGLSPIMVGMHNPSMSFFISNRGVSGKYKDGVYTSYSTTYVIVVGDIMSFIVDFDAGKIWFQRNGVFLNAGANPETGANPDYTFTPNGSLFYPVVSGATTNGTAPPPVSTMLSDVEDPWTHTTRSFPVWAT